jgi:hypothetical protein
MLQSPETGLQNCFNIIARPVIKILLQNVIKMFTRNHPHENSDHGFNLDILQDYYIKSKAQQKANKCWTDLA